MVKFELVGLGLIMTIGGLFIGAKFNFSGIAVFALSLVVFGIGALIWGLKGGKPLKG